MNFQEFQILMQTVADGWNEGDPRKAADCFTNECLYMEPPDKQLYRGKHEVFLLSGGNNPEGKKMKMIWHNLFFNEETQSGAGEYTFEMSNKNHGVVVVELKEGKIAVWREYQWEGNLTYEEFLSTENKNWQWTGKDL